MKKLVLGNAAVAEGALASGVDVVTGYPGTPSSEVIPHLAGRVNSEQLPIQVEWSVNEKVALDAATAAAWSGKRALVTMKMAGLNVASDTMINIAYKGVTGALVIYVADDPGTHAGCTEQDSRYYAFLSRLPILNAADPEDAKRLTCFAFLASEKIQLPVILRATTNVAHTMGVVEQSVYPEAKRAFVFTKNIPQYTTIMADRAGQHQALLDKLDKFASLGAEQGLNTLELKSRLGVIAAGVSWTYLQEAIHLHDLDLSTLKLDCENPWPRAQVKRLLEHCDQLLVLEEQDPIVEDLLLKTMAEEKCHLPVMGKGDGTLSRIDEYSFELVLQALSKLTGRKLLPDADASLMELKQHQPHRTLTFCIGCQHRATYMLIGKAVKKLGFKQDELIVTGDIGCTSLGTFKPLETVWTETTMGASIGMAHGFKLAGAEVPVIAALGDSTFFHSGIAPLVNAIQHGSDLTVIVMDNTWTAMTGFQPNPSTGLNALEQPAATIKAEQVVKALGVYTQTIKPYEVEASIQTLVDTVKRPGVKVIIAEEECALQRVRREGSKKTFWINPETCRNCHTCIRTFGCPAISVENDQHVIDPLTCIGCGTCAFVCPFDAIEERK